MAYYDSVVGNALTRSEMCLDTARQELQSGLVWVAEQIPGLTLAKDVTQTLERGYWPSYNVPYFREVRARCP